MPRSRLIPPARWKLTVGVVDQDLHRPELGLHLFQAGRAGLVRRHVPFVNRDAGLGLEFFRGGALYGGGLGTALADVIGVGVGVGRIIVWVRGSQPSSSNSSAGFVLAVQLAQ